MKKILWCCVILSTSAYAGDQKCSTLVSRLSSLATIDAWTSPRQPTHATLRAQGTPPALMVPIVQEAAPTKKDPEELLHNDDWSLVDDYSGYNPDALKIVSSIQTGHVARKRMDKISSIAWAPHGKEFATAGSDDIKIWNAETCSIKTSLHTFSGSYNSIAYSPNSQQIVGGSALGQMAICDADVQDNKNERALWQTNRVINRAIFNQDGTQILSGNSRDLTSYNPIDLWDIEKQKSVSTWTRGDDVYDVLWLSNNEFVAVTGGPGPLYNSNKVFLLDIRQKELVEHLGSHACPSSGGNQIVCTSDATTLMWRYEDIIVCDLRKPKSQQHITINNPVICNSISLHADDRTILTLSPNDLHICDKESASEVETIKRKLLPGGDLQSVSCSPTDTSFLVPLQHSDTVMCIKQKSLLESLKE